MARAMLCWVSEGVFTLMLILSLPTSVILNSEGICTRNQVVTKTRPYTYYKTFMKYSPWHGYWVTSGKTVTEDQSYTTLESKQYCCPGYAESTDCNGHCPFKCTPVCDFTCSYGKCTAPNYCECNSGYEKKPGTENICEPVCSQECVHGYCSRPEFCSCNSGYEHNHDISTSPYICSPVCSTPCTNAECTFPDVCSCFQGFSKLKDDPHRCHAYCSLPCHNGVCVSPDQCTCFENYEKENSTWNVCNPVCSEGCTNAACTAPGQCTCLNGYTKIENTCEPVCTHGCQNAVCTGPETCSCLPGYGSNSEDPYSCFPTCSSVCINGNCTEPDRCECFLGFEETDNPTVCRPYCSDGCENGVCTEPEKCTCLWGFQSDGNSSNCIEREGENLECSFVNEFLSHNFDKYCFQLTGELLLKELENCKILQYLLSKLEEKDGRGKLDLYCEEIVDLKLVRNKLYSRLECSVDLNNIEEKSSTQEFSSTMVYTEEDTTVLFTSTFQVSSSETFFTTDDGIDTEISTSVSTLGDSLSYSTRHKQEQRGFKIISEELSSKTPKLSDLPINLNITLKFFSLVSTSQMTHDYFDNFTSAKDEWCICHKNQESWNICASSPVQLHLCLCNPKAPNTLVKGSSATSFLKTTAKLVIISVAAVLVVYIVYTIYNSGFNVINRSVDMTISHEPIMSIDMTTLDGGSSEENT